MAREVGANLGREVLLARTNHGLTVRRAARLAGVAPRTQKRVEDGDPQVGMSTLCRVASAVGLKVWARAFPATQPTLRDTGQLWVAERLCLIAHASWKPMLELGLGNLRSVDLALFGPTEILAIEIERVLADFQAQRRVWIDKRDTVAEAHQRPVRLVIAVDDTQRNRAAVRPHADLLRATFPAGSREVLTSIRTGRPLGTDGIVWIRRRQRPSYTVGA